MKTDNELIAEFMGWEHCNNEQCKESNNLCWTNPRDCSNGYIPKDKLKFNTSWVWLMPVVEKIESLEFTFIIDGVQANIMSDEDTDKGLILKEYSTKIQSVYFACVEFIKWYNTKEIK